MGSLFAVVLGVLYALHSYGTGQCWGVEGGVRYASMVRRRERRVVGVM